LLKSSKAQWLLILKPLYNLEKIQNHDREVLRSLFGADNVYDDSGVNPVTQNVENYDESHHDRPQAARKILKAIYAG